jgi:glutamyl-tRNA synthetase
MNNKNKVVTRFAPSPTGYMHVGGVRTALFSWLFAKKNKGTFILRIEDTDKAREIEGSIAHIIESLSWLGIHWDEGPDIGGPHAPYVQSQRLDSYKKYAQQLIEKGYAYPDPYTEEEVEAFRKKATEEKRPFLYRDHRPGATMSWDGTMPLRFKVPEIKRYTWQDVVRGELSAGEEALDDFILIKSDGYPTYNFSHIIDDIEMGTTHIMRGEEFISSTPKFLSLYDALGVIPPHFATMPVILAEGGKKKLGKRDGAKDILDYRKEGYLPQALINFLALLGWHPEDEQEIMTTAELIEKFDIVRVQKGGANFDETKLKWFNHEHIKMLSSFEFELRLRQFMEEYKEPVPEYLFDIVPELQARSQTLGEAAEHIRTGEFAFMEADISFDPLLLLQSSKADAGAVKKHLEVLIDLLKPISDKDYTAEKIKKIVFPYATEVGRAGVLWPMRVALSGREKSPDPFVLADLIGKEKALARIEKAAQML